MDSDLHHHRHGQIGHDHSHEHDAGHGHAHGSGTGNRRRLFVAALLTAGFMLAEAAGSLVTGSLALIADAGHMLTDAVSLLLAYVAYRVGERPGNQQMTYGFDRLKILVAYTTASPRPPDRAVDRRGGGSTGARAGAGARRADARGRGGRAHKRRRLRNPPRRRPQRIAQHARRASPCRRRSPRLGRGDACRRHHPGDGVEAPADPILSVLVALLLVRSAWVLVRSRA